MSEWVTKPLSDLVAFHKGKKVDTWDYPAENRALYLGAGSLSGRHDGYASLAGSVQAKNSDVLMLWDGERSGLVSSGLEGVVASTVMRLTPTGEIDSRLLTYILSMNFEWIQNRRTGTGIPHVPKDLGRIFKCKYPVRIREQKNIANILQTIDEAIERTEQLIEKYQQIKAGLMHDLFTRGIGADGKLRPPREQAPELYWESPIGWIPKDWAIRICDEVCTRICVGIVIQPTKYYVEDGIPAFRSANVREYGVEPTNFVYISPESNDLLSKSQIKEGDLITVRTGYPGTSAVVPKEFSGSNCVDILISTPGPLVDPNFLCSWVNSSFGKGQVLRLQGGMAQQHFNVGEMKDLRVVVPSMEEQVAISRKIQSSMSRILTEQSMLEKLKKQKSGLMHDLLTGKVPVSADLPDKPVSPEEGAA